MKVVLPADTTFVQINRIPVELCVCRKDLGFVNMFYEPFFEYYVTHSGKRKSA